jgi:DNA-binding MarR family transcriptional regulator
VVNLDNPLDNSLGFRMAVAARSMKRSLEIKLNEYGITSSQYTVLEVLWKHNGLSLSDLGKLLYFDNPTITGIIDRMEEANFVRRRRDKNNRRVIKVHLTQKGLDLKSVLPKIAKSVNKKAVEDFEESEKEILLDFAKRLHKNLLNND